MQKRRTTRTPPTNSLPDPATAYAQAVVAGEVIAGPHVRAACQRHLRDLEEGPRRGLTWDLAAADRALRFFPRTLRLAGGQFEGVPFELHPSQAFIVGSLFGWKRSDGTRRFRRAYIEQGKGNGKSPLAAGIGMYCLVADNEARAEVYAAASKKDQAMVLFRDAVAMRDQSKALRARVKAHGGNPVWNLTYRDSSFFRPISSEEGQSGPRPSCALCDEIHEHKDGHVIEMLERGFKWRRQPLLLMITNSGTDRNSVCWHEHEHAVKVAAGDIEDDSTFSYVCSLDEGDDPLENPACWAKANPLLGVTITEDYLAGVVRQAKAIPGKLNGILRLHFCVWTDAESAWMSRSALESVLADFDPAEHLGKPVCAGVDLSATTDLAAMAFIVETGTTDEGKPTYDAWVEAWTPRDTMRERSLRDKAPYDVWVERGFLNAQPGRVVRFDYMAARLAEIEHEFGTTWVAYDRYAFRRFEEACDEIGLEVDFIEHPQGGKRRAKPPEQVIEAAKRAGEEPPPGLWMPGSVNELETLILEGRIRIKRNPVLISAAMSAVTEKDPFDNRWFSKRKATNRIDPIVALAMAVGAATFEHAAGPARSVYETRGILMV